MKDNFTMFAAYNGWANERLYDAAGLLDDSAYRRDVGVFFGSMHRTLNHILVADLIWMKRFTGEGENPGGLDTVLFEELAALREAREAQDARIASWIAGLGEQDLAGTISFRTIVNPQPVTQKLAPALSHFFNHQTHHRGQSHAILSILGQDPPSLDLVYFLRSERGSKYS